MVIMHDAAAAADELTTWIKQNKDKIKQIAGLTNPWAKSFRNQQLTNHRTQQFAALFSISYLPGRHQLLVSPLLPVIYSQYIHLPAINII